MSGNTLKRTFVCSLFSRWRSHIRNSRIVQMTAVPLPERIATHVGHLPGKKTRSASFTTVAECLLLLSLNFRMNVIGDAINFHVMCCVEKPRLWFNVVNSRPVAPPFIKDLEKTSKRCSVGRNVANRRADPENTFSHLFSDMSAMQ